VTKKRIQELWGPEKQEICVRLHSMLKKGGGAKNTGKRPASTNIHEENMIPSTITLFRQVGTWEEEDEERRKMAKNRGGIGTSWDFQ